MGSNKGRRLQSTLCDSEGRGNSRAFSVGDFGVILTPDMFELVAFFVGASVGSFVDATVHRVHRKERWALARSQCIHCGRALRWFELVPIVSFVTQRGRCRQCSAPLNPEYLLVEIVAAMLFLVPLVRYSGDAHAVALLARDWAAIAILLFIFLYDLHFELISDRVTLPAIAVLGVWSALLGQRVNDIVVGCAIGGGFFLLQHLVSRGRWVGGGDIRMGALMGALLGWQALIVALYIAYVCGALIALALIALGKKRFSEHIPFGAVLAPATLAALWWGSQVIEWYERYISV